MASFRSRRSRGAATRAGAANGDLTRHAPASRPDAQRVAPPCADRVSAPAATNGSNSRAGPTRAHRAAAAARPARPVRPGAVPGTCCGCQGRTRRAPAAESGIRPTEALVVETPSPVGGFLHPPPAQRASSDTHRFDVLNRNIEASVRLLCNYLNRKILRIAVSAGSIAISTRQNRATRRLDQS